MISIVIITNDVKSVFHTVNGIYNSNYKGMFEIVVVYKGINNNTFNKKNLRFVKYYSITKKKITIPEQRNVGIREAKGQIIVFIDANCFPGKSWLRNLVYSIEMHEESIVAGRVVSEKPNNFRKRDLLSNAEYISEAPTINIAISKQVFDTVGYFDEAFEYGSDMDFTWRAVDNGFKIKYESNAVISHEWGGYYDELLRAFRYGKARVDLYSKHKIRIQTMFRKDPITIFYPTLLLITPFIMVFPIIIFIYLFLIIKNFQYNPFFTIIYNLIYGYGVIYSLLKKLIYANK